MSRTHQSVRFPFSQLPLPLLVLIVALAHVGTTPANALGGYEAYSGLPMQGVTGEGIAGNGADQAQPNEDAGGGEGKLKLFGKTIKAPVAPVAPPRVPLLAAIESKEMTNRLETNGIVRNSAAGSGTDSVNYRPAPPPVRRETRSEGECHFDPAKWQMHAQSAAANAIMFDRTSGLSCDECLTKCASREFQDHSSEWICRTVTYDHRWRICDLFAVNGTQQPYYLLDYEGRDYFEYMAAFPPTDMEMLGISNRVNSNDSLKKQRDALGTTQSPSSLALAADSLFSQKQLSKPDANANNEKNGKQEEGGEDGKQQQCSCPCKALAAELAVAVSAPETGTAQTKNADAGVVPLPTEATASLVGNEEQEQQQQKQQLLIGDMDLLMGEGVQQQKGNEPVPLPLASEVLLANQKHQQQQQQQSSKAPLMAIYSGDGGALGNEQQQKQPQQPLLSLPSLESAQGNGTNSNQSKQNDTVVKGAAQNVGTREELLSRGEKEDKQVDGKSLLLLTTTAPSSSSPSSSNRSSSSSASPSLSNATLSSANSTNNQIIDEGGIPLPSSSSSSELVQNKQSANASASASLASPQNGKMPAALSGTNGSTNSSSSTNNSRKAFSSKSYQPKPGQQIRVPFRKTLEKVSRIGMRRFTTSQTAFAPPMAFSSFSSSSSSSSTPKSASSEESATSSLMAEKQPQKKTEGGGNAALSAAAACAKPGQMAHYMVVEGRTLNTRRIAGINGKLPPASEKVAGVKSAKECMDACDTNNRGHLASCNSAQFSPATGCEVFSGAANHSASDSLTLVMPQKGATGAKSAAARYMEKLCLDSAAIGSSDENAQRHIFTAIPGFILVGHVQEVSNAASLGECLKYCLLAEADYGFTCKSLMFYPTDQDQNCLMNSDSRYTQPDVFVPEESNVYMLYMDIGTAGGLVGGAKNAKVLPSPLALFTAPENDNNNKQLQELRRLKDSPVVSEGSDDNEKKQQQPRQPLYADWTRWSRCQNAGEQSTELRHRYLKCKEAKDVRKCPKESMSCKRTVPLNIQRIWKVSETTTAKGGVVPMKTTTMAMASEASNTTMMASSSSPMQNSSSSSTPIAPTTTTTMANNANGNNDGIDANNGDGNDEKNGTIDKKEKAGASECLAVRDARGRKRCPYGMRWNGTKREFCRKPIDC